MYINISLAILDAYLQQHSCHLPAPSRSARLYAKSKKILLILSQELLHKNNTMNLPIL
jgi:hypothetical protein